MSLLDANLPTPVYRQLEELIKQRIARGELRAGERIPSENELAEACGISRMTVRKALDRLVMEGHLFRRQGKGTYVAEPYADRIPALFSFAGNMSAQGLAVRTAVVRQRVVPAPPGVAERLGLPRGTDVIEIKRLRFVAEGPAAVHTTYLDYGSFEPLLNYDLSREGLSRVMERIFGLNLSYSREVLEVSLAAPADAQLLEVEPNSPVYLVEGVAFDAHDHPVKLTRGLYRGDRFQFTFGSGAPLDIRYRKS